jgi:mono/diheme cytochrome c family protein
MTRQAKLILLLAIALLLGGCAASMKEQPKYEPLDLSEFYADGRSSRDAPANTVARGVAGNQDAVFVTGKVNGTPVPDFPFQLTVEDLRRGQSIFNDVCAPCHGQTGAGNGIVVQRGFTTPPQLYAPNIVAMPTGQLYDYTKNGFGAMPPYGPIVQPGDLWRVIGYVRVLQLSQTGRLEDVPPELRDQIRPEGGQ